MMIRTKYIVLMFGFSLIALGSGCSKEASIPRNLSHADADFASQQYDRAEIGYLTVLKKSPLNPHAILQMGLLYQVEGRMPQAVTYLKKAVELQPENIRAKVSLGQSDLSFQEYKESWELARQVLQKQPTNQEALFLLAQSTLPSQVDDSLKRLESLPSAVKSGVGFHLARGTLYFLRQETNNAEGELRQALAKDPQSSDAWLAFGTLYWMRKDLVQAESAFKTAAELSPLRSRARLSYAEYQLQTGAVEEARKSVEGLAAKAPDYIPAWSFLAQLAFAEHKNEDCSGLVQKILARDPINFDALLLQGNLFLGKGDGTNAISHFEKVAATYKRAPKILFGLALAHLVNKDMPGAIGSLRQAISINTNYTEAILLLAELNIRNGDSLPAIGALTQLLKLQPQIPQAYALLANAYLAQKNPSEALAVYRRMRAVAPNEPQVPLFIGMVYIQQGSFPEARQAFEKCLEISPQYLPALERLAELDVRENRFTAALDRVTKQRDANPTLPDLWLLLAKTHMARAMYAVSKQTANPSLSLTPTSQLATVPAAQEDVKQAETALLKTLELNPNVQAAYLMLAQLYVAMNQHQQALAELATKTNSLSALMQMGMIYDELKQYPAARDVYEKLLGLNPKSTPALNNLAYLFSEHLGLLDKAYEMADRAQKLEPGSPYTADTLGWILFQKRDYTRALGLIAESAGRLPGQAEVQFHLGMTYYMLGEEDSSRLALENAVVAVVDFPGKDTARRHLAMLTLNTKMVDAAGLADLEKQFRDHPNDPVLANRLASIYEQQGIVDKAAQTYERVLKLAPKNASAMGRLAGLYANQLNQPAKAIELAKDAHNLAPDNSQISVTLGRLVASSGDYKWALSLFQQASHGQSAQPELNYDLAWAYYNVGQVAEGESTMAKAVESLAASTRRDEAKQFLSLVSAARNPSKVPEATAMADAVLKKQPSFIPALFLSARNAEHEGKNEVAKSLYSRIYSANPLFIPALRGFTLLSVAGGDSDTKTYDLAAKARQAFPSDPEVSRALGILSCKRGDASRAVQLLKESSQMCKPDSELLYYLGTAHYQLKQVEESRKALQSALSMNPDSKLAEEVRRLLTQMSVKR